MATTWITWMQAADLTGLPVPTIDYNSRIGRIRTRPHHGSRPCVDRDSALAFADWHRTRAARRAALKASKAALAADRRRRRAAAKERARTRVGPPKPEGWLSATATADILECTAGHPSALARKGKIPAVSHRGRWWFPEEGIRRLAADRGDWVSTVTASTLVGCAPGTIARALSAGQLEQRIAPPGVPSISRRSLTVWAASREAELTRRAEERRQRESERARTAQPPGEVVWLGTQTTALLLGLSAGRVRQLARADRLPHTWHGGRLWFARHHMEQVAAARALTQLHDRRTIAPPPPGSTAGDRAIRRAS